MNERTVKPDDTACPKCGRTGNCQTTGIGLPTAMSSFHPERVSRARALTKANGLLEELGLPDLWEIEPGELELIAVLGSPEDAVIAQKATEILQSESWIGF